MDLLQVTVLIIIFFSTLTRSTFGFGDALIAMPLVSAFYGVKFATPFIALIAVTISVSILIKQWKNVDYKSALYLVVSSFIGIPVGILLLKGVHESVLKIILAAIIIIFAFYKLLSPKLFTLKNDRLSFLFGFVAGILGGAYNTNGPPIVIYSSLKNWDPVKIRATLQGYFLFTGGLIAVSHYFSALWTPQVLWSYAIALPVVLGAVVLGGILNRNIPKGKFDKYIYVLLILIGAFLLVNTVFL